MGPESANPRDDSAVDADDISPDLREMIEDRLLPLPGEEARDRILAAARRRAPSPCVVALPMRLAWAAGIAAMLMAGAFAWRTLSSDPTRPEVQACVQAAEQALVVEQPLDLEVDSRLSAVRSRLAKRGPVGLRASSEKAYVDQRMSRVYRHAQRLHLRSVVGVDVETELPSSRDDEAPTGSLRSPLRPTSLLAMVWSEGTYLG